VTRPAISLPSEPLNFRAVVNVPLQINLYWEFPLDTDFGDATAVPLGGYIVSISTSAGFSTFEQVTIVDLLWHGTTQV